MSKQNSALVIITGVGYKEVVARRKPASIKDIFNSPFVKPNIGSCVANELARIGFDVLILSRSVEKLRNICDAILRANGKAAIYYSVVDLLDERSLAKIIPIIRPYKEIHLVHSAGLGAASYKIKHGNPYQPLAKTPLNLPLLEFEIVVKSLLIIMKKLLPIFRRQSESRIVVISSMSSIRAYPYGFSHASAKAGLHHAVRSLALELNKSNIFVSEVLPGIVDTGFYDDPSVISAVKHIAKSFGYNYGSLPKMHPIEVAKAVALCLTSNAHILSINLVAKGQWPHLGA